jgi:hypothetical protein
MRMPTRFPWRRTLAVAAAVALSIPAAVGAAGAAELKPETVAAWNAYVAAAEARIARELGERRRFLVQDFEPATDRARVRLLAGDVLVSEMFAENAEGDRIDVPSGMIHHWRGAIFVPGVTLHTLLARLQHPKTEGPHQEDVLAVRILEQEPDHLRLFIKMTKKKIVTVTYNSEHDLRYVRHSPTRASSRSETTKITELDNAGTPDEREKPVGQDRGFLWKLNSYWRYEEVPGGVIVECESLSLSRDIPWGIKQLISPIVDRIARQSMSRTLDNLSKVHAAATTATSAVGGRPRLLRQPVRQPGQSPSAPRLSVSPCSSIANRQSPFGNDEIYRACISTTSPSASTWSWWTLWPSKALGPQTRANLIVAATSLWMRTARSATVAPRGSVKGLSRSAGLPGSFV